MGKLKRKLINVICEEIAKQMEKMGKEQVIDGKSHMKKHKQEDIFPQVEIKTTDTITKVFIDGNEVRGVGRIEFVHDRNTEESSIPVLRIDVIAARMSIDTALVPELPAPFRGFYVSSRKLENLGIITNDQLNDLLGKGLL